MSIWQNRRAVIRNTVLGIFAALMLGGYTLSAWTFVNRHQDALKNRHENCVQIELLKTGFREAALDSYSKLDRNGRLLHIKITPAIRKAAFEELQIKLRRYKAKPC